MRYIIGIILVFPLLAVCEEVAKEAVAVVADPGKVAVAGDKFFEFLLKSIGGFKGLKALGIVGLVSQIAMRALQTPLIGKWAGKWKLLSIYGLSLIGGIVALMTAGKLTLWPALLHSNTLAMAQVFGHQAYKQFLVKKK